MCGWALRRLLVATQVDIGDLRWSHVAAAVEVVHAITGFLDNADLALAADIRSAAIIALLAVGLGGTCRKANDHGGKTQGKGLTLVYKHDVLHYPR